MRYRANYCAYRGINRAAVPCRGSERARRRERHAIAVGHRIHGAIEGYAAEIVRLIGEAYDSDTVQTAWHEFTGWQSDTFQGCELNAELFFSWLFHEWVPLRERGHKVRDEALYGIPPTQAYLDRYSFRINPILHTYLEACITTSPRFYEVLRCTAGIGFQVRDVFTGTVCCVSEALASTTLAAGHILYAHLVPIGRIVLMEAISPFSFPPHSKGRLLQLSPRCRPPAPVAADLRRLYFELYAIALR